MNTLNYNTLKEQGFNEFLLQNAPERILQFGEGNFLRAFVDYFVDEMNEKADFNTKIVICQPIENGLSDMINEQDGLYTLYLRGFENGEKVNKKRVISSVSRSINPYTEYNKLMEIALNPNLRFIASNTTEAGITFDANCKLSDTPPSSFPAKLTQFLYKRYSSFDKAKGFVILSCELIDNNGKELENCVLQYAKLWNLNDDFTSWIKNENIFCSTLVDRIVTGYPRNEAQQLCEELGYTDNLIDTGEIFGFWVIEGPSSLKAELPFEKASLPVIITENHKPYKQRKVRILNGAHTSMVLGAYLAGKDNVGECMSDETVCAFMNKTIYDEIIPTLTLPKNELTNFAKSVEDRFNNPFIDHKLLSISLNSTSKWKARVMPSLKEYVKINGNLPTCLVASFAFYIMFFKGYKMIDGTFYGNCNNNDYIIADDKAILDFYYQNKDLSLDELAIKVCKNTDFWGEDLTKINGFCEAVSSILEKINTNGAYSVMRECVNTQQ